MKTFEVLQSVGVVSLLLVFSGCAWVGPWLSGSDCVVVPVSSEALPSDLSLRARVKLAVRSHEVGLEVIARATAEELVVVGISEAGPRLFAVQQRGREMAIEAPGREFDRLATWVMDALHRALFIEPPVTSSAHSASSWMWAGERVREWWEWDGRRREFTRVQGGSSTEFVTVDYSHPSGTAPQNTVQVRNPSCGYEAVIVVLERTGSGAVAPMTKPRGSTH